jgi:hypothetical protein
MGVVIAKIDSWSLSANKKFCFKKVGHPQKIGHHKKNEHSVVTAKGAVVFTKGVKMTNKHY